MRNLTRTAQQVCAAAAVFAHLSVFAATLSITPNAISNEEKGAITLQISGLNAGESVNVERITDFNGDGVADSYDFTLQAFPLADGAATVIGSVTNLHVPGDLNTSAGEVTAKIHMSALNFQQRAIGKSIYRVSSPTSRFAPVTASFTVTNAAYSSQVTGQVKCNGVNVPYALVVLFQPAGDDLQPAIIGAADGSGNYSIKTPPGMYMAASFKSNYVANFEAPVMVSLSPGGSATADLSLTAATRRITGRISDKNDAQRGLGGLMLIAEAKTSGFLALGFPDRDGNFSVGVVPGLWQIGPEDTDMHFLGYAGFYEKQGVDCTSADATGVSLQASRGTSLIYGTVATDLGIPMPGIMLWAEDASNTSSTTPIADENGRYFAPVVAGSYQFGTEASPLYPNYVFSRSFEPVSVTTGSAILRNVTAKQASYLISGYLKDPSQNPVGGIQIWGVISSDGIEYATSGKTDDTGLFAMPAFNGQWSISSDCDGYEGLRSKGYRCSGNGVATVANANATVNLVAEPCSGLQVSTSTLPNAQLGQPYSQGIMADSCDGSPYVWSLAQGSGPLPPGLTLQSSGFIGGTPTQQGTWSFIVKVQQGTSSATKGFSLTVENNNPPLSIVTSSLAQATNGIVYSVQLSASGGVPPYNWDLAPGSGPLPQGLFLNSNGQITGTPAQAGEFWFRARVKDSTQATAESLIRITVVIVSAPLNIVTASLGATEGIPCSLSMQATGGQQPYFWSVALGSAGLPAGLSMNTSGQIYGTPTTAGTFYFIAAVTDNGMPSTSDEQLVTFTVNTAAKPVFAGATLGTNGKLQIQVNGTQGTTYTVQASADLANWFPIGSTNAPSNSFTLEATPPPGDRGFIRLKVGL